MSRSRRKTVMRVVEAVAAGLVALDVVLYLVVVRPLHSLRAGEEASYTATRERLRAGRARVARLQKFQSALPGSEEQLAAFLKDHVTSRRRGFSSAVRLMREQTDKAGLLMTGISYKLSTGKDDPLERLNVDLDVEGPFANLLSFTHALETSEDFIALRDFAFQPGEGNALTMHVGADLFLQP